jgi:hypothetical protein
VSIYWDHVYQTDEVYLVKMGYFTKEVALTVNYTNHRHFELCLGMEWIGPKWLPLLLPMCVGGSLPLHS